MPGDVIDLCRPPKKLTRRMPLSDVKQELHEDTKSNDLAAEPVLPPTEVPAHPPTSLSKLENATSSAKSPTHDSLRRRSSPPRCISSGSPLDIEDVPDPMDDLSQALEENGSSPCQRGHPVGDPRHFQLKGLLP